MNRANAFRCWLKLPLLISACISASVRAAEPPAGGGDRSDGAKELVVHLISGCGEYKSEPSLTALREYLERNYRVRCTASWLKDGAKSIDNLDEVAQADVLIVYARRFSLPEDQMQTLAQHWEGGKPVIGIRTAGHAFDREYNKHFDSKVLGGSYAGHYGNEEVKVATIAAQKDHPILDGVGPFTSRKLYKAGEIPAGTTILQTGNNGKAEHPVTIVNEYKGGRVFFTALGVPEDFEDENFRRMLVNAIFWTAKLDPQSMHR